MKMRYQKKYFLKFSGFTLVEILIGLTLLSLIMLLLFSSLHTAGKSWSTGEQKTARTDELQLASNFIRQRISQTVPLIWINRNERRIVFKGSTDAIHFVAPLPAHRGGGGLYLLTLKLNHQDDEQQNLDLYYRPAAPDRQTFDLTSPDKDASVVVAENIKQIEFSYFGNTTPDETPQWQDQWDDVDQLPKMIRVKLLLADLRDNWTEMLIAIHPQAIDGQPQFYQFSGHDQDTLNP